jgi:hypothetical protein
LRTPVEKCLLISTSDAIDESFRKKCLQYGKRRRSVRALAGCGEPLRQGFSLVNTSFLHIAIARPAYRERDARLCALSAERDCRGLSLID